MCFTVFYIRWALCLAFFFASGILGKITDVECLLFIFTVREKRKSLFINNVSAQILQKLKHDIFSSSLFFLCTLPLHAIDDTKTCEF